MSLKKILFFAPLLFIVTISSGCATLFGGKTNTLIVEQGTPPDANIYLDNQKIGTAPFKAKINKYVIQHGSKLEFRKEGFITDTVIILRRPHPWYTIGDIFTLGIGLLIDAADGALFRPRPNKFQYTLKKNKP